MLMIWLKTFAVALAWPIGGWLAATGAIALVRDAEMRPEWFIVAALLAGAAVRASWVAMRARERALVR